jgi:hypothetical protein
LQAQKRGAPHLRLVSPAPPPRKTRLAQICFKLERDIAALRREVASLRAAKPKTAAPVDDEVVRAREAARRKRIEDREAAKQEYAEAAARQALFQPERDQARAEWLTKDAARKREKKRLSCRGWHAANPERSRAIYERAYQTRKELLAANPEMAKAVSERRHQRRKERRAAKKQIEAMDL